MPELSPPSFQQKPQIQRWWVTATFIAINVGLFVWQIISGVDISHPSMKDAIRWGADYAPLTFLAEPQRLFSSMFFHFGLLHLMLNMWALYIFGSVAEQLLGHRYYLGLYVLAGLMGSLLSGYVSIQDSYQLLQHFDLKHLPGVSAGASGAVLGIGAALTVLALLPALPRQIFLLDKKALLIIMGINLSMGFLLPGINNAAHVGGIVMGATLAALWYLSQRLQMARLGSSLSLLLAAAICWWFYQYCLQLVPGIQPLWMHILQQMRIPLGL